MIYNQIHEDDKMLPELIFPKLRKLKKQSRVSLLRKAFEKADKQWLKSMSLYLSLSFCFASLVFIDHILYLAPKFTRYFSVSVVLWTSVTLIRAVKLMYFRKLIDDAISKYKAEESSQ